MKTIKLRNLVLSGKRKVLMISVVTNTTDRQDYYGNTALCTIVHRAVKIDRGWTFAIYLRPHVPDFIDNQHINTVHYVIWGRGTATA